MPRGIGGAGQGEPHFRATADLALDARVSTVSPDQVFDDGQSQAGPLGGALCLGRKIGVEYFFDIIINWPGPISILAVQVRWETQEEFLRSLVIYFM